MSSLVAQTTTRPTDENIILAQNRHKPESFRKWKAIAFENLFKTIYGVPIKLEIGEDQFECCSDFIVCRNVNRILIQARPQLLDREDLLICVSGDCVGLTSILKLFQFKPKHLCVVCWQNEEDNNRLAHNIDCSLDAASENFKKKKYTS